MDDCSPTESFPNLHHHRHRPPLHLTLPSLQSPEAGYQPALDPLEQYGSRGGQSAAYSSSSSAGRKGSRGFQHTSDSGMGGDDGLRGHRDRDGGLGSHFDDPWCGGSKKEEVWEDSDADVFYSKADCYNNTNGDFYTMSCGNEEGLRCKLRANYNNYTQVSCDAKSEVVYNREANFSTFTKCHNSSSAGSLSDTAGGYCRTDSRVSDHYLGREEDYGSSCGSGEDQLQPAEVEAPWLSMSPSSQPGEGRWRGEADAMPLRSPVSMSGGTYTQKLDSFSEAFLSQRRRRFPVIQSGNSSGQLWEFGETPGFVKSGHSCAFDSDSYLPPASFSSPAHHSLPSFPSPPTSSHLVSSVLSPPPTPLPPPSHSPSKMDSPGASGGSGQESLGPLQFFTSRLEPLPSVHCSGMMLKFPLLSQGFPQSSGDPSDNNFRSSHVSHYGNINAARDHLQSPESPFLTSSFHHSSLHPSSRDLCSLNTSSVHLPSPPSHLSGSNKEAAEDTVPYLVRQKVKNGPAALQHQSSPVYTGTPFPSVLRASTGQKTGHYTPRPLLNPTRRGTGLYSSLLSLSHKEDKLPFRQEEEDCGVLWGVNVGFKFQAELPPCCGECDGSGAWSPGDEAPREELLWKPWQELEERANLQNQVGNLLALCSSSCLPGGGSNTELALHCLHHCQGNTLATLEMLLFWQPSSGGDYHYSGSGFWTDAEKSLFGAALGTYGKDFSLIHKTVKTKTVSQCVEFYYLSKKLVDKQRKQQEDENRDEELEKQKSMTPICQPVDRRFGLVEAVPAPSLASFFPCKLCGKMFYKIKSRNAHMKIHRQPQEDWADRRLRQQLLTQRLALSRSANLLPGSNLLPAHAPPLPFTSSGTSCTSSNADNVLTPITSSNTITPSDAGVRDPSSAVTYNNNITASNSHVISTVDAGDSNQREPTSVVPFHQSWSSFGHGPTHGVFYSNTDEKEDAGDGAVGGKEPIIWQ